MGVTRCFEPPVGRLSFLDGAISLTCEGGSVRVREGRRDGGVGCEGRAGLAQASDWRLVCLITMPKESNLTISLSLCLSLSLCPEPDPDLARSEMHHAKGVDRAR